jgi:glycosyltransferase involved in cell wall biosynthesis
LFNSFDSVALLTQDTQELGSELEDILHVPCAYSKFAIARKILYRHKALRWFYFSISSFIWLLRNRSKVNLLISENVDSPTPFLFSFIFKIPYFIHYHYDVATQVRTVNKRMIEGMLLLFLDQLCFKKATGVWATSSNLVEKAKGLGAKKVTLIPNWVKFIEPTKRQFDRLDDSGARIIFVGRLHPVKRVPLLVEAFCLFSQVFPDARLIIVGDGDERKNLERLIKNLKLDDRVDIMGFQDHDRVLSLMAQSDMIVLPSIIEGNPRVLVEAMMLKVPIVATNVAGITDMVKHDETGYLVSRALPEALAQAMKYILMNKEYSLRITENAFKYAKQHFSREYVLEKIRADFVSCRASF